MAYLNVRERRIETTIAYVGAEPTGSTSNFERLRASREGRASSVEETTTSSGAILSFEWWPNQIAKFDDCDVMVKLVTTRGAVSDEDVGGVLANADGVVVVLSPDPSSLSRNKESVAAVRSALARERKTRPVVIQVDAAEAAQAAQVAEACGAADWPFVEASTTTGAGIYETLERALSQIIETMKRNEPGTEQKASAAPRATSPRTEGNPLLSALKQILQATVAEHIEALEQRVTSKLEAQLTQMRDDVAALRRESSAGATRSSAGSLELPEGLGRVPDELRALRTRLDAVEENLQTKIESVELTVADMPADVLALRELAGTTERTLIEFRREIAAQEERTQTAAEARSRADREHATAAASVLRRAVEAVATDVREFKGAVKEIRKSESGESAKEIVARLELVATTAENLRGYVEPTAVSVKAIPARIDEIESKVQKQIRDELSRRFKGVDEAFSLLQTDTSGALARVDARSAAIEANLIEFITELKQRKKGWFG